MAVQVASVGVAVTGTAVGVFTRRPAAARPGRLHVAQLGAILGLTPGWTGGGLSSGLQAAPLERPRVPGRITYVNRHPPGLRELPIRLLEGDMPGTSLTESPLRELASRVSGGAEITLFWNERTGAVTVSLRNRDSGPHIEFAAAPAKALEAFYHPYAHAASTGTRWHDTPRAA